MFKFLRNKKTFFSVLLVIVMIFSSTASLGNLNVASTSDANYKTLSTQSRSDSWIEDLQANYGNSSWYGGHLNATDRLMIREAMDYAIPRSNIIKSDLSGLGSLLATYAIPQEGSYYFSNITARPYDLTKAKTLLAEVFGYTYSSTDNPSTPYNETKPYFPLNLMVPNTQFLSRIATASTINSIYDSLGIGSVLHELGFPTIISRAFNNQAPGNDFNNGGFDGLIIGETGSNFPEDGAQWFGSGYIPDNNYGAVNSPIIDNLINQENNASLTTKQVQSAYYQMQKFVSNQSLKYILYQEVFAYLYSKNLQGFNPYFALNGLLPYQNLSFTSGQTGLRMEITGPWYGFNPLLENDFYSNYVTHGLWAGGLLAASTPKNTNSPFLANYYNNLASSVTVSSNGLFYNFTLRHGIKWADGTDLTANDVAFTYSSILTPSRASRYYGPLTPYLNNNSIHVYDNYHIGFQLLQPTVPSSNAESLFAVTILPKDTYNSISDWQNNQTETGSSLTAALYNSNGPYQISSINTVTGEVDLTINPIWQNSTYAHQFDVPGFNVTPTISTIKIVYESSEISAVNDIQNNATDFVDPTIGLTSGYSANIEPYIKSGQIGSYNTTSFYYQELQLNQNSTIWGFSPKGAYTISSTTTTSTNSIISSHETTSGSSTPFGDLTSILFAFVVISVFSVIRKKRKFK